MLKRLLTAALLIVGLATGAAAEPFTNHAIPIGRGPSIDAATAVGPAANTKFMVGGGTSADPVFATMSGNCTTVAGVITCSNLGGAAANIQSILGAADYAAVRTLLGLVIGTNVQAYDADLTTYAGITPSANVQSILGAANYAAVRTLLGLVIGTDVQAYNANLTTYAGIAPAANIQSILGAANYAAVRTLLGLVIGTSVQAWDTDLDAIAALSATNDDIIQRKAGVWTNRTLAQLKADINLSGTNTGDQTTVTGNAGTATALQTSRNIDGQAFDGTANITVIAPGTHAATSKSTPVDADEIPIVDSAASNALKKLTWLNLKATAKTYFDTLYQVLDSDLTTIAGLTATADNVLQSVGSVWASRTPAQLTATLPACVGDSGSGGTKGLVPAPGVGDAAANKYLKADCTWASPPVGLGGGDMLAANNLSDVASATTSRTNLGVAIGTNVQAYDADLTTYAGITPSANVQSILSAANYAAIKTLLALTIGTNVEAWDADLDTWAGVTPGSGAATAIATGFSSAVQSVLDDASIAAMRTTMGLGTGDSPQFTCIEVGAASDTSLCRDSAGIVSSEGLPLYSAIPQNSKSAAYTLVLTDAQKHIFHPSADTTARIWTIPANSSVAFPIGTTLTFVNQHSGGVITIAITTDTMRLAGAGTTGSRTLAADGMATALKITSTEWIISGNGLT